MNWTITATQCVVFATFMTHASAYSMEAVDPNLLRAKLEHLEEASAFSQSALQITKGFCALSREQRFALNNKEHCDFTRLVEKLYTLKTQHRNAEQSTYLSIEAEKTINERAKELFGAQHNETLPLTACAILDLEELAYQGKLPVLCTMLMQTRSKIHTPSIIKQAIGSYISHYLQEYTNIMIELSGRLRISPVFTSLSTMRRICQHIPHPSERVLELIATAQVPEEYSDRTLIAQEALNVCRSTVPAACQMTKTIRELLEITPAIEFNLESLELLFQDASSKADCSEPAQPQE